MSDSPEAKHEESAPASPEADEAATVASPEADEAATVASPEADETAKATPPKEIGGRDGPEPVRYGDWEKNGRCIDF